MLGDRVMSGDKQWGLMEPRCLEKSVIRAAVAVTPGYLLMVPCELLKQAFLGGTYWQSRSNWKFIRVCCIKLRKPMSLTSRPW